MNKRQIRKRQRKIENVLSNSQSSAINGWRTGIIDAYNYLSKELKREGFSLSGWCFYGYFPMQQFYVFNNDKKHKTIHIKITWDNSYEILTCDIWRKYCKEYNLYKHDTMKAALEAPWQHWNYVYTHFDHSNMRIRSRAIEKLNRAER